MQRKQQKQRTRTRKRSNVDLEEISPHRFYMHDPSTKPTLKGEGEINGQVFDLTSWRREGLLARLRNLGFVVSTLADQVDSLPYPHGNTFVGEEGLRPLSTGVDRYSYFDPLAMAWVQVEPRQEGEQLVVPLRDGWVVRRRRGRGISSYHRAFLERTGSIGLRLLNETEALMLGYAIATGEGGREVLARRVGKEYLLPDLLLPKPFVEVLARFAKQSDDGWKVVERGLPLAQELYAHLGLLLRPSDQ